MRDVVAELVTLPSAWGPVHVVVSGAGVAAVERDWSAAAVAERVGGRLGGRVEAAETPWSAELQSVIETVSAILGGDEAAAWPAIDWRGIATWDRRVLEGARTIRHGEVTSYGRLARRIGAPGAARAVGAALGRNPFWLLVPCHRVVAGDGTLGGYGGGPDGLEVKRDLLALEGVAVPVARLVE
jgi:methylated-DNA-[protein]-cysteine S-methyltransferase